jgi:UDP-glucuronate decarboxylase
LPRAFDSRKRILVTGGAGFLGSHLIDRLLEQGHEVICVDNLFSSTKRNIDHMHANPRFEFLRHDVCFPLYVVVDVIFNLACPASPIHYQYDPVQTTKTSVHGAINVLGLAKRLGCKILQASTSEVYGDPEEHPQRESYWGHVNCTGPRACYDEGKRAAEALCFDKLRAGHVDVRVARIFNTYGPRMRADDGRIVSNLIVQALRNAPLTIYGDGTQTRSFCYVSDLVDGLIALMNVDPNPQTPVNLGNPGEFTMAELAEMVSAMVPTTSKILYEPLPVDDPRRRRPDIARARAVLGWEPRVPLAEGLGRTIAWFAQTLGENPPAAVAARQSVPAAGKAVEGASG